MADDERLATIEAILKERDCRYNERAARQDDALKHLEDLHESMRKSDKEAIDKAFASATKLSEAHNDLLRKMEKLTETFATRDDVGREMATVIERSDRELKALTERFTRDHQPVLDFIAKYRGRQEETTQHRTQFQPWMLLAGAGAIGIANGLILLLANTIKV